LDGIVTENCKFLAEKILYAQNFDFAPKFSQNKGFQPQACNPKFAFVGQIFSTRKYCLTAQNLGAFHDTTDMVTPCFV